MKNKAIIFYCDQVLHLVADYRQVRPQSNVLNNLTEQHWTFVQQIWVLFSDVQLLGGQTYWTFCWRRLNFVLTIIHCARANWTNVQWLVKRTEQHSTSRKQRNIGWLNICSVKSLIVIKIHWTRINKGEQGGQTLWTFCTQQMFSVVHWNVQYFWLGPNVKSFDFGGNSKASISKM